MENNISELQLAVMRGLDKEERIILSIALKEYSENIGKRISSLISNEELDNITKARMIKDYERDMNTSIQLQEKLF